MPANFSPIFTITPKIGAGALSVANTGMTGTGTVVTLFTAGTNGSTVESIRVRATATTTAGMIRFWLYDGATYYLWHEMLVTAITPSGSVAGFVGDWQPPNTLWVLPSGWSVRAATHVANTFNVTVMGGDY